MRQTGKWLALLCLFIFLCSCQEDKDELYEQTPLSLGTISIGAVTRATQAGDYFLQDDKTTVTATAKEIEGKEYTASFSYRSNPGNWVSSGTPLYLEDVYSGGQITHLFEVFFGSEELVADQSTAKGFHFADYLTGEAELNPTQRKLTAESLSHQHVLVQAVISPGDYWGEDDESIQEAFLTHMKTTKAIFNAGDGVTAFHSYDEDEGEYMFSVVLPVDQVPASGEKLFTLTLTDERELDCTYTIEEGDLAAGKVLRVTASYDAMSLLSFASATFTLWTDAVDLPELGGAEKALDSFLAWAARCNKATSTNKENYTLTANIDLTGIDWVPIGKNRAYGGIFDGGGYTISGIHVDVTGYAGLFGRTSSATIKNLHIKSSSIKGTGKVGSILGEDVMFSKIIDCTSTDVEVSGTFPVGGIIGTGQGTTITNCIVTKGLVSGIDRIGGIAGLADMMGITGCQFISGNVTGGNYIGGIVGYNVETMNSYPSIVQNCLVQQATISGSTNTAGGITGQNAKSAILACACLNTTIVVPSVAGGIVGNNESVVAACYVKDLTIEAQQSSGGIVGENVASSATVISCYAIGKEYNVPTNEIGGIAGYNSKVITTCYFSEMGTMTLANRYSGGTVTNSSSFPLPVGTFFDTDRVNTMNSSLSSVAKLTYKWEAVSDGYPILINK